MYKHKVNLNNSKVIAAMKTKNKNYPLLTIEKQYIKFFIELEPCENLGEKIIDNFLIFSNLIY